MQIKLACLFIVVNCDGNKVTSIAIAVAVIAVAVIAVTVPVIAVT